MKKIISCLLITSILLVGCGKGAEESSSQVAETKVRIGLTGSIYEDIWNPVAEELKEEGILLELVQFSDFSIPNAALVDGEIELNAFQHHAFFNNEVETKGYDIVDIGDTFIVAMNLYSNKVKDITQLQDGAKIAIPQDASNGGRALKLLQSAGLITLSADAGNNPEVKDIESTLVQLEIIEADAANVYSLLPDVDAAVINGNYALDCGLNPKEDAIYLEKDYEDNKYFCLIAVRAEDKDNVIYKRIVEAYQTENTKKIFTEQFNDCFVPIW